MEALTSEREAFEAAVRQWPNYSERTLARDGRYPEYYGSPVVQGAWESWKARAHLAQPAQAVDVGAIREVIAECQRVPIGGVQAGALEAFIVQLAPKLTRALSGEKAGPVGDGWQPIETAPKDKRILCCWLGAPGYEEVDVAINCTEKARGKVLGWCSPHDCDDRYCAPDYWMPMPEPPTSSTPGNEVDG